TLNQNYATGALLASAINSQLGGGASATAVSSNGKLYLEIKSAVGVTKSVQVQSDGTANSALGMTDNSVHAGTAQQDVGFGATGITNTGVLGLAGASSSLSVLDAGGTMQTGALSFSNITSGTQALTISANDANGGMQSLSITLASQSAATASLGNAGSG